MSTVTDAMVDAAQTAYENAPHGKFLIAAREAMRLALEAAERARSAQVSGVECAAYWPDCPDCGQEWPNHKPNCISPLRAGNTAEGVEGGNEMSNCPTCGAVIGIVDRTINEDGYVDIPSIFDADLPPTPPASAGNTAEAVGYVNSDSVENLRRGNTAIIYGKERDPSCVPLYAKPAQDGAGIVTDAMVSLALDAYDSIQFSPQEQHRNAGDWSNH